MQKKGQAAMEFLMTYGWAILAAVIAIGVLAYFGVFSPGKYMPSTCVINSPLGCDEHSVTAADGVRMIVRNGAGDSITLSAINITNCGSDSTGWTIANGDTEDITIACDNPALSADDKFSGEVTITYMKSGGTIAQETTGTITGKVA